MEWIRTCNLDRFNVIEHFSNYDVVDWNRAKYNICTGDIVYIYVSHQYKKLMFKTQCICSIVASNDIDNYKSKKDFFTYTGDEVFTRLKLLQTIDTQELSLYNLRELGLINGNIQGAYKSENHLGLFSYIDNICNKYLIDTDYTKGELEIIFNLASDNNNYIPSSNNQLQATSEVLYSNRKIAIRNPQIAAYALKKANYLCEVDPSDRVFLRPNGKYYTEPHHLIPLSKYKDF